MARDLYITINVEANNHYSEAVEGFTLKLVNFYMNIDPFGNDFVLTYTFTIEDLASGEEVRFNYWFNASDKKPMNILNWALEKTGVKMTVAQKKNIISKAEELIEAANSTQYSLSL